MTKAIIAAFIGFCLSSIIYENIKHDKPEVKQQVKQKVEEK